MTPAPAQVATTPAAGTRRRTDVLRLADGVELIGQVQGSGLKKPPLLVRRADGQMVQLSKLLYAVAALSDGRRDAYAVAEILTQASNRRFTAADVMALVEKRLRPAGVLNLSDGTARQTPKREPLMALRHRRPVLPERAVNVLARPFMWLHRPLVTAVLVLGLIGFDVWLFGMHGLAGGLRSALYHPELLLAVLASVVVATAFHEIGHASACRYSGGRPGAMGVGFYLVYPAFYCDVTDAYRLNRAGRLRTDLAGVYFNGIFALLAGGVYLVTGQEAALLAAAVQHVILLQQLLPLMRFDGYYVLTDLTGVPDILSRIKPIFRSLVRGRRREPQVAELKRWVRVAVTAYLITLVPALAFLFVSMVMSAPRIVATAEDSFWLRVDRFQAAQGVADSGVAAVGLLALVLPLAAMTLSITRVSRMAGRGLSRWSRGSALRRVIAALVITTVIGALAYAWWPDGDYDPIEPGERGTIGEAVQALSDAPEGWELEFPLPHGVVAYGRASNEQNRAGRGAAEDSMPDDDLALLLRGASRGPERHAHRADHRLHEPKGTDTRTDAFVAHSPPGVGTDSPDATQPGTARTTAEPTTQRPTPTTTSATTSTTTAAAPSTSPTPTAADTASAAPEPTSTASDSTPTTSDPTPATTDSVTDETTASAGP